MMTAEKRVHTARIGVVGASSLLGKELIDALNESALAASEFVLLDDEEAAGQIAAAGDEAAVIQPIDETSFDRMDYVFFAGSPETTKKVWKQARHSGASIVDLTSALDHEKDVLVRAPWIAGNAQPGRDPDLKTSAVVSAHPASLMLALAVARLKAKFPLAGIAATVMTPASEHGRAAMDELHQQTVNLLSFQSLPRELYDAQAAFNLLPVLGEEARIKLDAIEQRIHEQFAALIGGEPPLMLQMVQAPVFHGYVISAFVELGEPARAEQVEKALAGEHIDVVASDAEPPSNLSAAGRDEIMVRVKSAGASGVWLWMAADNLKLAAINAIACACELGKLRPQGKVQ
ncbi:MAG: segregation protein B [Acidobacteriaceae bacterium]|nr:segregation protein B [Acidobacteriaceae bacterium]